MRPPRPLALSLALLLASAGGVATASTLTSERPAPDPPDPQAAAVAGSDRIATSAADPEGGPDWALRAYDGRTGASCLLSGRFDGKAFGPVIDGRVRDTPADGAGSCSPPAADPVQLLVARFAATASTGARTVIYGRVREGAHDPRITVSGQTTPLSVEPDGTFLRVDAGLLEGAVRVQVQESAGPAEVTVG